MIKLRLLLLFLLVLTSKNSNAQNFDTYWNYDISDGLPSNSIYHLFIDSKGKIWFGSDLGVTCFDGQNFRTYTTDDGLEDNTVLRCFEDKSGRIWFHHNNRLPSYYDHGQIKRITCSDKNVIISSTSEFTQLNNGNIYLCTSEGFLIIKEDLKTKLVQKDNAHISIIGKFNDSILIMTNDLNTKVLNTINYNLYTDPIFYNYSDLTAVLMRSSAYFLDNFKRNNRKINIDRAILEITNESLYHISIHNGKTYVSSNNGVFIFSEKNGKAVLEKKIL